MLFLVNEVFWKPFNKRINYDFTPLDDYPERDFLYFRYEFSKIQTYK